LATSSSQAKEKKRKHEGKKNHREEKICKEGRELTFKGAYLQAPALTFHFWLPLLPFRFKHFFLVSSSFQREERKKNTEKKKTIEKKKNVEKGGNLPFFFRFCIWDEALLLLSPLHIPSMLNFPPSSNLVFTSLQSSVLLKLGSSPELWRWNEREVR
jgi:hypothetical protein